MWWHSHSNQVAFYFILTSHSSPVAHGTVTSDHLGVQINRKLPLQFRYLEVQNKSPGLRGRYGRTVLPAWFLEHLLPASGSIRWHRSFWVSTYLQPQLRMPSCGSQISLRLPWGHFLFGVQMDNPGLSFISRSHIWKTPLFQMISLSEILVLRHF